MKSSIFKTLETGYHEKNLSHGQEKRKLIIEAGIQLFHKYGIEQAKLSEIAKKAGVTRTNINHHFGDREGLFMACVNYVREDFQLAAVNGLDKESDSKKRVKKYILNTLSWGVQKPKLLSFWILFFYSCSHDEKMKKQNTYLVDMGTERISSMLEGVVEKDHLEKARLLQNMIIGLMLSNVTENRVLDKKYIDKQVQTCLKCLEIWFAFIKAFKKLLHKSK